MSALIILDFETTGLNPERDQILEMAMVALEYGTLREVAAVSTCLNVPSGVFGLCDDRAHAMHEQSGLKAELWGPRAHLSFEAGGWPTYAQAQASALAWLQHVGGMQSPLGGYNPGFDRGFLKQHMPNLERAFHYRQFDVNFCHLLREVITGERVGPKTVTHRALDDCRHAAQTLRDFLGSSPG
jgi:oligoribonuclease